MLKWFFMLGVVGVLTIGCKSADQTSVLSNTAFVRHFATPEVTTNVTAGATNEVVNTTPSLIAPGMFLTVTVAEEPNMNRQYPVPPTGMIDVLGVGRIKVTGLTAEELALKIKQPLERDFLQKATVTVNIDVAPTTATGQVAATTGGGGVVYVLGNVGRPGPLMLPRDEVFTLTKVIVAAGGFSTFGNGAKVRVLRYDSNGKKFETRVNVDAIMKRGEFEKDIPIQNGDWIIVPEKWINF